MMDKVIVPYVQDDEHNAPKHIRLQAYSQVHLSESPIAGNVIQERGIWNEQNSGEN